MVVVVVEEPQQKKCCDKAAWKEAVAEQRRPRKMEAGVECEGLVVVESRKVFLRKPCSGQCLFFLAPLWPVAAAEECEQTAHWAFANEAAGPRAQQGVQ